MSDISTLALSDSDAMEQIYADLSREVAPVSEEVPDEIEPTEIASEEEDETSDAIEEEETTDTSGTDVVESEDEVEPTEVAEEVTPEEPVMDAQGQLDDLFTPFKANGKQVQITSIAEAKQLMQMGANYNKKMATLKPNLKMLQMLENNDLLDETKLNYLIDLASKKPEAIANLVRESGIDPLELDLEKDTKYVPESYTVDDTTFNVKEALEAIQDTPSYAKTMSIISNKMDTASKNEMYANPRIIHAINDHVDKGYYDQISGEVERQRMLGNLADLSDLHAYLQVGNAIQARGGFNSNVAPAVAKPVVKSNNDDAIRKRKLAAAGTKSGKEKSKFSELNALAMSDDEFMKQLGNKFN